MSRIGNSPIQVTEGVELIEENKKIHLKGPKGVLELPLPEGIELHREGNIIHLKRKNDTRNLRAVHGTTRALLNNHLIGVTEGWKKDLELIGVGYRVRLKGRELSLSLGYSHDITYPLPDGVDAEVKDQTKISLSSINKQHVGQAAAKIRSFRPPEPYKGKGIRFANEVIVLKAGKSARAAK